MAVLRRLFSALAALWRRPEPWIYVGTSSPDSPPFLNGCANAIDGTLRVHPEGPVFTLPPAD